MSFYKNIDCSDKSIGYMFLKEVIIMGIHGEIAPLIKKLEKN